MADKTTRFNKTGITILPDDKPVVYKITTEGGKNNYTGTAQRGRVQERLAEHLAEGRIPGAKVKVEQQPSIKAALEKEARVIARSQPPTTSRASNASLWGPSQEFDGRTRPKTQFYREVAPKPADRPQRANDQLFLRVRA